MRRLAAALLLAALAGRARADDPTPEAIRAARDAIFRRSEFRYGKEPSRSLLAEWFDAYQRWLGNFREEHPMLFLVVVAGLALTLVVLVAHIVWTLRVAREARFEEESLDSVEAAIRRLDPRPLRERALAHAAAGRFDDAVRDLYTALLFTLDRRGSLRYARHKALLDYRMESARDADAVRALDLFVGVYHPGSFGRRPPDRPHFDALLASLDAFAKAPR